MRRYHEPEKILVNKDSRVMTRKILRSDTCLLYEFEPKSVKDDLNNGDYIQVMNNKIEQIEKNKTSRPSH